MKTIVITGGTSGIGKSAAEYFTANGDNVFVLSRNNEGNMPNFYPCDVSDAAAVARTFTEIGAKCGTIDVLVNSAGYGISGAAELIDIEVAKQLFAVNVFGTQACINAALPFMTRGGKIINISSVMAEFPIPFRGYYGASKAAVSHMTLSQRMELAASGIQVAAVLPGDTKTNFTKVRVKDFKTNERYGDSIKKATERLDAREGKRMPPEVIGKAIFRFSQKKRMKPFLIVGAKFKLLKFANRFLPLRLYLKFANKIAGDK